MKHRQSTFILSLIALTLSLASCGDKDDDKPFQYSPDNHNSGALSITFDLGDATVDSAFMARTSGFCRENRKDLTIKAGGEHSFTVQFPSPNYYNDPKCVKVDTASVYTKNYTSDLIIDGADYDVKTYFTMVIPFRLEGYYADFEYALTQVEIGGRKVDVTPITYISGTVNLAKDSKGEWQLVEQR